MIAALVAVVAVPAALFLCLFGWCLGVVEEMPSDSPDPIGDVVIAWWLTLAWVRAGLGGEIDSRNCAEDI